MFILGARAHDYGKDTPNKILSAIANDGWSTIQLAFKKAFADPDLSREFVDNVKQVLLQNNLSVGVLGAYVEPSMADEQQRKNSVDTFCSQIPVAKTLSAGCIGTETTNMDKQPEISRKQALTCLRLSLSQMLLVAQSHEVMVAVEPVFYHAMNTPEETKRVIDDMKSEWLGTIFDPVNLLSPDLIDNQHDLWKRSFDCFGDKIRAVHIKGVKYVDGNMISCPLKESIVDYEFIFKELKHIHRDIPVFREEVIPNMAKNDMEFIKSLC